MKAVLFISEGSERPDRLWFRSNRCAGDGARKSNWAGVVYAVADDSEAERKVPGAFCELSEHVVCEAFSLPAADAGIAYLTSAPLTPVSGSSVWADVEGYLAKGSLATAGV